MKSYLVFAIAALLAAACGTKQPSRPTATEPLVEQSNEPIEASDAEEEIVEFECEKTQADWPMFQRTPDRHGVSDAPALGNPTIRWSAQIGIASWLNNPVIADGRVYAPSSGQVWNKPDGSDGVYSFDLATGEQLWFQPVAGDANGAAYADCRLFVTSDAGTVSAFDARSGEELWVREFEQKVYANPLPLGDTVVVGGAGGGVAALNVADGEPVWTADVGSAVRGGASTDGERVYVTTVGLRILALDAASGEPVWTADITDADATEIYAAPTVDGGQLYVSYVRNTSYSVPAVKSYESRTGKLLWSATNTHNLTGGWGNIRSSPAFRDGRLYWGEPYSNRIVTLDADGGDVANSVAAGTCMFPHWPSPAIAGDLLYVGRHDGGLYALDTTTGTQKWSYYLGDARSAKNSFPPEFADESPGRCSWDPPFGKPIYASPAVAEDGTIVVSTGDGWVHALGELDAPK